MARQSGPLKYKGTLGDIRHFKIKGLQGHFAGLVGGPTGEQVKTAPEFERTRENMNEFGGCAAAGKSIRVGLAQLMKQMSDPQLTGRLTAIMKKINLEDLKPSNRKYPGLQFNNVLREAGDQILTVSNISKMKEGQQLLKDISFTVHKGDKIVLAAFGGGFTWGATLVEWAYDTK